MYEDKTLRQTNDGTRPYLNEALYATFKKYFDRVAGWYWGHEHNFIVFENNLKMADGDPVLRKGRLLGCSAYEETQAEDPYKINYNQVRFFAGTTWRLNVSQFADPQTFYNHAFAIFDIAPEKITVNYYEYPSWGQSIPTQFPCDELKGMAVRRRPPRG